MKEIFTYSLPYQVKEKVTVAQEDGSELTTLQEVEKKIRVIIKEPTRKDVEAAKNIYQETWSDAVRRGILTRAIIDKTYSNSNGFLSDNEKKNLQDAADKMIEIKKKYENFKDIKEEDQTEEQKIEIKKLSDEFLTAKDSFDQLDQFSDVLYRNSAETIASEKQLLYNTLFLSYVDKDGKIEPIVGGESLSDKLSKFDSILDNSSSDEAKEKAKLYDTILYRNGRYLELLSGGKLQVEQLKVLNEKVDSGEIAL